MNTKRQNPLNQNQNAVAGTVSHIAVNNFGDAQVMANSQSYTVTAAPWVLFPDGLKSLLRL
jgi:hypothetical protein